jgi:3-oxoacyl-[acyl-carrier-protein] synthase II
VTEAVAVTGIGAVTALGAGAEILHRRAVAGESGIEDGLALCRDFKPTDYFSRKDVRRTDRFTQFALVAAGEAVAQAGWEGGLPYPAERVACVIGSGVGGIGSFEEQLRVLADEGPDFVSPLLVPMLMANSAAAQISIRYGFRGQSYCLISACSAGAQAIGAGLRTIRTGEADAVIVGGAEAATSPIVRAAFLNAGALSPTGTSVPFDRNRDGFIIGEGAGVLVLERAELAAARGAPVLAQLRGYGASTDAHHLTAPEPTGTVAASAVRYALLDAGAAPADIGYINAHGTGTALNDQAEVRALRLALGQALAAAPISSSKSYLGHLLGAAGAVEAVATVQALRYGVAPPTVGLRQVDEGLADLRHVRVATPLERPVALSTSFGFGGHNAALVLSAGEQVRGA